MKLDSNVASIQEAIDAGLLAGAVTLVCRSGEVLQVNELGHRDVDAGLPMQRDTIFRIASMSKPVTIAAAMSLVEEGRLSLTDQVANWLPELSLHSWPAGMAAQSTNSSACWTVMVVANEPSAPMATDGVPGIGLLVTQRDEPVAPVRSTPPTHKGIRDSQSSSL